MLFLLPLGAFASCPAGLKLSNVPISTALPYCVKWESSTLGGCEVSCPGVCVEFPIDGTKGPMETTGGECSLGGGDGGTGGDGSGGGGHNSSAVIGEYANPPRYVNSMLVGPNRETDFAPAVDSMLTELGMLKIGVGHLKKNTTHQINLLADIEYDTSRIHGILGQIENHNIQLGYDLDSDLSSISSSLDAIVKNTSNGNPSTPGEDGGFGNWDDVVAIRGDVASLKAMTQSYMNVMSNIGGNTSSMESHMRQMSFSLGTMSGQMDGIVNMQSSYLGQMNGNMYAIKALLQQSANDGGDSGDGATDVDYSKMPGSAGNPLQVAGAEYKSGLCQEGDNCAFDLGKINKQYDDKKTELKDKYGAIKDEVSQVFKFQFSGSASAPKCFDMFSIFGKSYQVCPEAEGYWETLAAIMMFIFYFIALMIVARR
ncbi:hypothetical protein ACLH0O_06870 [Aeromonas media]|uniref:hypothetical protein n=1 Tax=Aeromonas rivipollensis TaxID=948519 RepID=UPI0038CFB10F